MVLRFGGICVAILRVSDAANAALDVVESRAPGEGSITEAVVAACSAGATVGEITDRQRVVFGSCRPGGQSWTDKWTTWALP